MRWPLSNPARAALLGILSTLLLFMGFTKDFWNVASKAWFGNYQRDSEGLVIGRLVESRQGGLFSSGGLLGYGFRNSTEFSSEYGDAAINIQYSAYGNGDLFRQFYPYESQIGAQGMLFGLLDKFLPQAPRLKLSLFHGIDSLLLAIILSLIVVWFYWEFGLWAGVFVLASALFSQFLAVFGRNLYWSTWSYYLPLVMVAFYLRRLRIPPSRQFLSFGALIYSAVLIKSLFSGDEYITATLVMMMVPFVFYCVLDRAGLRKFLIGSLTAVISSGLAILSSFVILCIQVATVEGSFQKGIDHIVYVFQKRSYADYRDFPAVYANSLKAGPGEVLVKYLNSAYFDFTTFFSRGAASISGSDLVIRYWVLILVFGLMTLVLILLFSRKKMDSDTQRKNLALVSSTWFSILAPFSWLIIFKAHAYIHLALDPIVWQMPFTLYGFAVCGLVIETVLTPLVHQVRRFH
jgi:hypothetical protein